MNTQEVTDSHTLKVTQTETHKNTTYGVQRERQLYSDTHRQTDVSRPTRLQLHTRDPMGMGVVTPRDRHSYPASHHNRGRARQRDRK